MSTKMEQLWGREVFVTRLRWFVLGWLFIWLFIPNSANIPKLPALIFLLIGVAYNVVVTYAVKTRYRPSLSALTVTVDSLLVTLAVFITGGIESELWPLFFLIGISSSMVINVALGAELLIFNAVLYFAATLSSASNPYYIGLFAGRVMALGFAIFLVCFLSGIERKIRKKAEAVAAENASLFERVSRFNEELEKKVDEATSDVKRRYKQMEIVYKIGSELTSDIELDAVLGSIIKGVQEGLGYDRVGIFEVLEDERAIKGRLGVDRWGKPENIEKQVYSLDEEGNSLADVAGGRLEVFFTEDAQADLSDIQKKYIEPGVKQNAVVPMKARDKVIGMIAVDNLLSKKPIDKEGLHLLMTFAGQAATAISNARMMGKERAHGVKIRKIEEFRQDFLSKMSHEVRTPLASIKESLSLVLDGITGPVTEEQIKFLRIAEHNLARVVKLVDDLFEMVKSEFKKVNLEIALISLRNVADDVIYEITPQAQKKGISLDNQMSGAMEHVHADKAKIHAVMSNLIRNAIRYTPEKGHIGISSSENEEEVRIEVKDDGIGVAMQDQLKIFEKYYKVDSKVHDLESGAGLGLAISKEIVEAHGGKIWVESQGPNTGSKFIFTLPKG